MDEVWHGGGSVEVVIGDLNEQEIQFLKKHNIELSDIYDGRRQQRISARYSASQLGYNFIFTGGQNCSGRHRIQTKSGHCPQCKTSSIAFVRRENSDAYVYLASASGGNVVKIGFTSNIYSREETLRKQSYGGRWDWRIICFIRTAFAGKIEREIAALFIGREIHGEYQKDGSMQAATEMFEVNEIEALKLFKKFVKSKFGSDVSTLRVDLK